LRYSDPDLVENWRRSTVDAVPVQNTYSPRRYPQNLTVHPPSSPSKALASPKLPRNSGNSSNIGIEVEPPTDSDAYGSQPRYTPAPEMLSPFTLPPSRQSSPYRQQSPRLIPIRTGSPAIGRDMSGTLGFESSAQLSPLDRDSRDKRRTIHEHTSRSGSPHRAPGDVPSPRPGHSIHMSLSMNAGSTPLRSGKPLSPLSTTLSLGDGLAARPRLRKQPSAASSLSSNRSSYKAYDPNEALDPAYLASSSAEYGPSQTYAQHGLRGGRS